MMTSLLIIGGFLITILISAIATALAGIKTELEHIRKILQKHESRQPRFRDKTFQ